MPKAARLQHYQKHADRLTAPLKRQPDGSFKEISWDVAIQEIADQLVQIRDKFGGTAFASVGAVDRVTTSVQLMADNFYWL